MEKQRVPFQTKQEWLYSVLKSAIERCEIPPGERLILDELAAEYHVSRVPVREALLQLQMEGLVQMTPHVGAVVAPITQASAQDYFAISRELQVLAVRAAAVRMKEEEKKSLEAIAVEMETIASSGNTLEYSRANRRFHDYIKDHCHMPLIPGMIDNFHQHWHRFERYYNLYPMTSDRMERTLFEHRELVEAIKAADPDRAEAASRMHNITGLEDHLRRMEAMER